MKTLALIGVGRWGKNILSTLEKIPEVNLKYLCARNIQSLSSYGKKYENVSDWHTLLKKQGLDAALIVTHPSTHSEIAAAFLEHGVSVFVEKPMALNVSDAEKLRTLVRQSGKVFMAGYQYLFNDNVRYVKEGIEKGDFGKILSVTYEHILSPSRPDVDIFFDAGPHPLSVFEYLFKPAKLTVAEGEIKHDEAFVKIQFSAQSAYGAENAPALEITASCVGEKKVRRLSFYGERSEITIDETLGENKLAVQENGKVSYPPIRAREPLKSEMEHFLYCLETGETPLTDIDFGCRITEWLEVISKKISDNKKSREMNRGSM